MSSKNDKSVEDDTSKSQNVRLLINGATIVWITFWLTWLILAVISHSLGVFKLVLIFAILLILIFSYFMIMAFNLGGK